MTALAILASVAFILWFQRQWHQIPRRWDRDLGIHDWHAEPGTSYEICRGCGDTQPRRAS